MQKNSAQLKMFRTKNLKEKELIYLQEDFRVRLFQLVERGVGLRTQEGFSFLKSQGFSKITLKMENPYPVYCSKMLKVYLAMTVDKHLLQSMKFLPTLITPLNAKWSILSGGFPKTGNASLSLEDIMEDQVEEKYFLSIQISRSLYGRSNKLQGQYTNTITARYEAGATGSYIIESELDTQKGKLNKVGNIDTKGHNSIWGRVYNTKGVSSTLNSEGGGLGAKTGLYQVNPELKTYGIIPESDKPKGNWLPRERVLESKNGLSRAISTSQSQHPYYKDDARIRRLTPVECARLQGFPDGWTDGQSDSQRYNQIGNAVSVPVIKTIVERIYDL